MASHGYDGHGAQAGEALNFVGEHANLSAGHDHAAEFFAREADGLEQTGIELLGAGIEQLRGGGDGVLAHFLAGEHPRKGIGHEEYLAGMAEGGIILLTHGVELEDGVEVHELDAGGIVDIAARDDVLEIIVHGGKCNRIAIRARVP